MDQVQVNDARQKPRFGMVYAADLTAPEVKALRPVAFRVWVVLTTYTDRSGGWAISLLRIADDAGISGTAHTKKATVRKAVDELEASGLVYRTAGRNPAGTGQGWNRYELRTPPSVLAAEGGGESPPGGGGESPPGGGGKSPPRVGGESPPPYQTTVHTKNSTTDGSPPTPPPGGLRHDRRKVARIAGLHETINRMREDAKNRLFDEEQGWERLMREGQVDRSEIAGIIESVRVRLYDEIAEYGHHALEEIERAHAEEEARRAPRRGRAS